MSITINVTDFIPKRVNFCWPKPDTRLPASQRPKPNIEGFVECEFIYHSQETLENFDGQVEAGEMTTSERFEKLVPTIKGLPLENGETAHQWIDRHEYGAVIRAAIFEDYWVFVGEGRQGNSAKRRSR